MLSKQLSRQLFWLVTIFITLQFVFILFIQVKHTRDTIRSETKRDLAQIVTTLEQVYPLALSRLMQSEQFLSLSHQDRTTAINLELQPLVEEISRAWPGYGMGYYLRDYHIVSVVPYRLDLLGRKAGGQALRVYKTQKMTIVEIDNGFTWGGQKILSANYPLQNNGQMIGHVWANITVDRMGSEFYRDIFWNIVVFVLMWLLIMLTLRWALRRSHLTVSEVIHQISDGTHEAHKLRAVPELIPVLQTVQSLKQNLKDEYEAKQRLEQDLARLDRLHTVGEMAAAMAHEIRNPMTVVMGYTQMMAQQAQGEERESFHIIIEELRNVNQILEDFLSISREREMAREFHQLNDVLQSVYPLIYAECVATGINLEMRLSEGLPPLRMDSREVRQLVLNLIRNAVEAMGDNGTITISTSSGEEDRCVCLSIRDNGPGIPQEILPKIFDPFYTTKERGTGLGLSICKSIVDRHEGTISVESAEGRGTSFVICFPVE